MPKRSTKRSTKRLGTGRLTIDTTPWTEVYLEDRKLGMTPLEGVRLPAGRHELRLKNGEVGLDRRVRVTIRAGKVTRIRRAL